MRGSLRQNRTATYCPPHNSISFPFSWAAQPGALGPNPSETWSSFQHILSSWSELQLLTRESWGPPLLGAGSLYSILSPTTTAQSGAWGSPRLGAGSLYRILSPTDLNFLSPGLYNNLTSTRLPASVTISRSFNPFSVKVISWYSSTGCTCYLHRCISYFDSSAGVTMQHYFSSVSKFASYIKLLYTGDRNVRIWNTINQLS